MNPDNEFGTIIPGISNRGFDVAGIGKRLRELFDGLALLERSPACKQGINDGMHHWVRNSLDWMETSETALGEYRARNNHGTYYDLLGALLSLYLDDKQRALAHITHFKDSQLPVQFAPDGTQR